MDLDRRQVVAAGFGLAAATAAAPALGDTPMYGLIGRMKAVPGQRDALAAILLEGTGEMPGCRSYIVAKDTADALWITEVWDSADSHRASLQLTAVQAAITRGRPLIAGFDSQTETEPLGGWGWGEWLVIGGWWSQARQRLPHRPFACHINH